MDCIFCRSLPTHSSTLLTLLQFFVSLLLTFYLSYNLFFLFFVASCLGGPIRTRCSLLHRWCEPIISLSDKVITSTFVSCAVSRCDSFSVLFCALSREDRIILLRYIIMIIIIIIRRISMQHIHSTSKNCCYWPLSSAWDSVCRLPSTQSTSCQRLGFIFKVEYPSCHSLLLGCVYTVPDPFWSDAKMFLFPHV